MTEEETLAELHRLYGDGRKMPIRRCQKCGFAKGFYFDAGLVRYDPGCYCKFPLGETKPLPEERLRQFIRHSYKVAFWIANREEEFAERAKLEREREKKPPVIQKPKGRRRAKHGSPAPPPVIRSHKVSADRGQLSFFNNESAGYCGVPEAEPHHR
jgi:hypothetical protein